MSGCTTVVATSHHSEALYEPLLALEDANYQIDFADINHLADLMPHVQYCKTPDHFLGVLLSAKNIHLAQFECDEPVKVNPDDSILSILNKLAHADSSTGVDCEFFAKVVKRYEAILFDIVELDNPTILHHVFSLGADSNTVDPDTHDSLFQVAVNLNHFKSAEYLLSVGVDINYLNSEGQTALLIAIDNKDDAAINFLLNLDELDLNLGQEHSALSLALKQGRPSLCKALLRKGADINHKTPAGNTPLFEAVQSGDMNRVRFLIEKHPEIDQKAGPLGQTALHQAITMNNKEIIELLMEECPDLSAKQDHENKSTLQLAVEAQNLELVQELMKSDISPDEFCDSQYGSPLFHAVAQNNKEMIKTLIDYGATVDIRRPSDGRTPLWLAAGVNHIDAALALLERGANVCDTTDDINQHATPVWRAAECGHAQMIQLLVEHDADIHQPFGGALDYSALHIAAHNGHTEAIKMLISLGANPNSMDREDNTPLVALLKGTQAPIEAISSLIVPPTKTRIIKGKSAPKPPKFNINQGAPVVLAAGYGRVDVINLLLKNNAKINQTDDTRKNLLHHAAQYGHISVFDYCYKNHPSDFRFFLNKQWMAATIRFMLRHNMAKKS